MSIGKAIDNVVIFGGIGAIGYLLLKKNKIKDSNPVKKYTNENGDELAKDTTFFKGINFISICKATKGGTEESDIELEDANHSKVYFNTNDLPYIKDLCDNLPLTLKKEIEQELSLETNPMYSSIGNTCVELDVKISLLQRWILEEYKNKNPYMANVYEKQKKMLEDKFNKFNCRDKIEVQRTGDVINTIVKGTINAEQNINKSSFREQNTYIALGSLVLLVSLYSVIKK